MAVSFEQALLDLTIARLEKDGETTFLGLLRSGMPFRVGTEGNGRWQLVIDGHGEAPVSFQEEVIKAAMSDAPPDLGRPN